MERTSSAAVTWRGRLPFGLAVAALAVVTAAVSLLWQAGPGELRVDDLARLAALAQAHGAIGAVAAWWSAFAVQSERLAHLVFLALLASALLALGIGWRLSRSPLVAAALALTAVASPFVRDWALRPLGIADTIAASALLAVFAVLLDRRAEQRARVAAFAALGGAAVLFSGWAVLPLLALAAIERRRAGLGLVVAAAAGLAVRAGLGFPLDTIAGRWSAFGGDALISLRLLVLAAAATPALVFALTRPQVAAVTSRIRTEIAIVVASLVLILVGGLALSSEAAFFTGELGVVLTLASLAVRYGAAPRARIGFAVTAGAIIVAGAAAAHGGADAATEPGRLARDRALVRASGSTFVLVDHGRPSDRERYSPMILAYLAGRPVAVDYAEHPPAAVTEPVLEAGPRGLTRLDGVARIVSDLQRERAHLRDDVYADAARGRIQNPYGLPGSADQQVLRTFAAPAPAGPIGAITVASRHAFTIDGVRARPGDRLVYLVAKAASVGGIARGTTTIDVPGRAPIVVVDDVPPATSVSTLAWRFRSIPLPLARPAAIRIRFEASSPSGTNIGDWVAYALPAVVPAAAGR